MEKAIYLKRIFCTLFFMLLLGPLFLSFSSDTRNALPKPDKKLVVIDAGHGGKDTGCKGTGNLTEKEIALKLAFALRDILAKKPNTDVILTRNGDMEIPQEKRVAFANSGSADIFLSLHINAAFDKKERGIEIYYYSEEALELTSIPDTEKDNNPETQSEKTGNYPLQSWDEAQNAFSQKSREIATVLETSLRSDKGIIFRAVKPAPLFILTGTTMPSLVIEAGFITNPDEASALSNKEYLNLLASKLADGIAGYFEELKKQ